MLAELFFFFFFPTASLSQDPFRFALCIFGGALTPRLGTTGLNYQITSKVNKLAVP